MAVQTMSLRVEGMTCANCEQRLVNALRRVDGVRGAEADHTSGLVRVLFDPDTTVPGAVADRINLAGYSVLADDVGDAEGAR